jgi:hypothetical protein
MMKAAVVIAITITAFVAKRSSALKKRRFAVRFPLEE